MAKLIVVFTISIILTSSQVFGHSLAHPLIDEQEGEPIVGGGWGGANSVELTDANWSKNVENTGKNWIVAIHTESCSHCVSLKPEWVKVGKGLKGSNVKVGHIDANKNSRAISKYNIEYVPTIIFFSKEDKDGNNRYEGERKSAPIISWAKEQATA